MTSIRSSNSNAPACQNGFFGGIFVFFAQLERIMLFLKENIQFDDFSGSALTVHQPGYLIVGLHKYPRTITASH